MCCFSYTRTVLQMSQPISKSVLAKIYGNGRGWSFSQKDFAGLGSQKAIEQSLLRLADKATIRRVIRGLYDYPRFSKLLNQEMGPDIHQVAMALARKFGWRIQPSGAAALNLIGLSTQVPGQYVYQSDGPDRSYQVGKIDLQFKHGPLKEAGLKHPESAVIVQAIKALGENQITAEVIQSIRDWLPEPKRAKVLRDTQRVTAWVFAAIRAICEEQPDG
jgi:hypothetical protein